MSLTPGTRLGSYEVVNLLGAGGMGEVYRARDGRLHREVAIKVLPAAFAADPERMARFEQEARAAAALNHPNILAVHDLGQHEGSPFIVTELLDGMSLRGSRRHLPPGSMSLRVVVSSACCETRRRRRHRPRWCSTGSPSCGARTQPGESRASPTRKMPAATEPDRQ